MDIVNRFGEEVNKVAKCVVKGTNNLVESTKLSLSLSELEDKLKLAYEDIGKKVYLYKTSCIDLDTSFEEEIMEINNLHAQIKELKDKLLDIKNKQKCSCCGCEIHANDKFCRNCGNRVD